MKTVHGHLLQNAALFLLAAFFYRRLGLSERAAACGMAVLAWAIVHSFFNSDLSFNTFSDILFYLIAGLLILARRDMWILPLSVLAILNRETSL